MITQRQAALGQTPISFDQFTNNVRAQAARNNPAFLMMMRAAAAQQIQNNGQAGTNAQYLAALAAATQSAQSGQSRSGVPVNQDVSVNSTSALEVEFLLRDP